VGFGSVGSCQRTGDSRSQARWSEVLRVFVRQCFEREGGRSGVLQPRTAHGQILQQPLLGGGGGAPLPDVGDGRLPLDCPVVAAPEPARLVPKTGGEVERTFGLW